MYVIINLFFCHVLCFSKYNYRTHTALCNILYVKKVFFNFILCLCYENWTKPLGQSAYEIDIVKKYWQIRIRLGKDTRIQWIRFKMRNYLFLHGFGPSFNNKHRFGSNLNYTVNLIHLKKTNPDPARKKSPDQWIQIKLSVTISVI